jgi:KaiC/GvpD/RAD55 family RecA-like ATPase
MPQMPIKFYKATKTRARLRLALIGPAGSGKTYTAIKLALEFGRQLLGRAPRVAVIDSERESASKYADIFDFDTWPLESFSPETYVQAIEAAEEQGYDVCVIDSLSHAWMGKDGALEQVDKVTKRSQSNNQFFAWREVTPMHNALVDAMLRSKMHIIATIRVKTEYVIDEDSRGKKVPRRIGLAPVQRDGLDYEFDVVGDMTLDNELVVSGKSRCSELKGNIYKKPGVEVARILAAWLGSGAEAPAMPVSPAEAVKHLLEDGDVKALFEKLGATEAKRRATCEKYRDRDTLVAALEARLTETEQKKDVAIPQNGHAQDPKSQPAA